MKVFGKISKICSFEICKKNRFFEKVTVFCPQNADLLQFPARFQLLSQIVLHDSRHDLSILIFKFRRNRISLNFIGL